jgi:aspartyl-tRNA(Asn)/glutamyl-tRNA(Gln) amidotransferase subunit C
MPIIRKDVEGIAELARLDLTVEETDLFTEQLSSIIGHIEKLNELDTSDVPPMSHCVTAVDDAQSGMRADQVRPSIGQKLAVENAPDADAGYFKVPRVIGSQ